MDAGAGSGVIRRISEWARRIKRELVAIYLAIRDPRTPWYAKALGAVVVGYAFSPIDLIPDFLPVLGYLDDAILLPLGIWLVIRLVPPEVLEDARVRADLQLKEPRPVSWAGAIGIGLVWVTAAVALGAWAVHLVSR